MGITRARRYANHPGGRKYKKGTREMIPIEKNDEVYQALMKEHKEKYEKEN